MAIEQKARDYVWPHPRFKKSTTREWLKGRAKYPTGFCSPHIPLEAQGHEGTSPKSSSGTPIRICDFYDTCPCTCHQEIDQMYEMVGSPRPPAEQSKEYRALVEKRGHETDKMLEDVYRERYASRALSSPDGASVGFSVEGIVPDATRGDSAAPMALPAPAFAPTPSGRRARGQLEYNVLAVCADYAKGVYDWTECLPKLVSEEIGKREQSENPSTGAIDAVWDRWALMEFAERAKKPSRFVRFTGAHTPTDLDLAKAKAKREKRRGIGAANRGTLRRK